MKKNKIIAITAYLILLFSTTYYSCVKDKAKLPVIPVNPTICDTMNVSYQTIQQDIIWTSCATSSSCHASGTVNGNFSDYDGVKPLAANGKIRERVIEKKDMPPGAPLPDSLIQMIDCWLKDGYPNN